MQPESSVMLNHVLYCMSVMWGVHRCIKASYKNKQPILNCTFEQI